MRTKKGIYFSFDAIIASVIFILTLISLLSYWYAIRESVQRSDSLIAEEALRISDLLYSYSFDKFGFANDSATNILDVEKIEKYQKDSQGIREDVGSIYDIYIKFDLKSVGNFGFENYKSFTMGTPVPFGDDKLYTDLAKVIRIA